MGDFFKKDCSGKWGYIFTGNFGLAKKIDLRSSRRIELNNSTIEEGSELSSSEESCEADEKSKTLFNK